MTLRTCCYHCCLALLLLADLAVSAPKVDEARVRAVVAYKITHFIIWSDKPGRLSFCTLGSDELSEMLGGIIKQAGKEGKISVSAHKLGSDFETHCDVLYIRDLDNVDIRMVLGHLTQRPVLTIGDGEAFARAGGMVGLYTENDKVRFAVNIKAVKQAGLRIKSQLLNLAKVIQ